MEEKNNVDLERLEKESEELLDDIMSKYIDGKTLYEVQILLTNVLLDLHRQSLMVNLAKMTGLMDDDE